MKTERKFARCMAALLVGLSLVAASCTDGDGVEPDNTDGIIPTGIPPEQQAAFADGTVDLNEYQGAFGSFRDCANDAGAPLVNIQTDPIIGYISFGVNGELSPPGVSNGSPVDDCYQRYFSYIEQTWQTTDPGVADKVVQDNLDFFHQVIQPCLEANGVAVPDEVIPGSQEFGELSKQFTDLDAAGSC